MPVGLKDMVAKALETVEGISARSVSEGLDGAYDSIDGGKCPG